MSAIPAIAAMVAALSGRGEAEPQAFGIDLQKLGLHLALSALYICSRGESIINF